MGDKTFRQALNEGAEEIGQEAAEDIPNVPVVNHLTEFLDRD